MKFDNKQKGWKSPRDESFLRLLKSPAIIASRNSTVFLSADPNELCDRLTLLSQEKQAGNNSDIINEEVVVMPVKYYNTNLYLRKDIIIFLLNIIYYTQRKSSFNCLLTQIWILI